MGSKAQRDFGGIEGWWRITGYVSGKKEEKHYLAIEPADPLFVEIRI